MNLWLSAGIIFTVLAIFFLLYRWGNIRCIGVTPTHTFTFVAILFTSGLDVGLIMFPLTEFGTYADTTGNPEYAFTNPLALEFGFWGFLIWGFYFLTCFYFCIIEPRVRFFDIPVVKWINNVVIIGTCAFTAYLLLSNLPWYLPQIGDGESIVITFYVIVFCVILAATYSSTDIKYVRILSLASTWLFLALIAGMWIGAAIAPQVFVERLSLVGDYFSNLPAFILPINDYHAFYLFWWFAWSIMIGQFTARFVGGLRTWQLLLALLAFPSIPLAIWFTVLYYYHSNSLPTDGLISLSMVFVGITFVINSLDSLIRLYTDNLNLTTDRLGKWQYILGNLFALFGLTLLFKLDFLQIQWVGAVVIGLYFACFAYILIKKRQEVAAITGAPAERVLDFAAIDKAH
ncbi:MAG TPA: BCCT family transporter [Thiolinea sp.]|nr:BCCT family transporter [Thiolinea sp.]